MTDNVMINAVLIYVALIILLMWYKPKSLFYEKTYRFKDFGCDNDRAILTVPVIGIISGIIIYMIIALSFKVASKLTTK